MNNIRCYKFLIDYIQKNYNGQNIIYIQDKAYSTLFFTLNYVFKVFPQNSTEYDFIAIQHEFEWDSRMPIIKPKLLSIMDDLNQAFLVLEMLRLPQSSNLLSMLLEKRLSSKMILQIGVQLWDTISYFEQNEMCWEQLYTNYMINLKRQLWGLDKDFGYIYNRINWVFDNSNIKMAFKMARKKEKPVIIHGNMFSGNIYYFENQLIILDPISFNHISKISLKEMDIASFLTDIGIFHSETYKDIKKKLLKMLDINETILQLYVVLKTLVRFRFALCEYSFKKESNNNLHYENQIIIENAETLFIQECEYLYDLANN